MRYVMIEVAFNNEEEVKLTKNLYFFSIREFSKINLTIWQNKNNDLNLLINRKIQGRSLLIWV